jgi:DNA-binding NtrC family response regulator
LPFQAATEAFQKDLIRQSLAKAHGKKSAAAESLGLTRHALRHQMNKLGMR